MSTLYPGALDTSTTIPVEAANIPLSTNHVTAHQNVQDALEAVEAKVGVDSSAVTTSHDYKLSLVTTTDKALPRDAAATTTNKILGTGTAITLGSDAEGDTYYRTSGNVLARLPRGSDNQILKMNGNVPNWEAETVTVDATSTTAGIVELATAAEITAGTATGGTGAALVVTPDQLLASRPVTEVQIYSTAGTASWTKPANAKWVEVTCIGAGGGGAAALGGNKTGGGGGGSYGFKRFAASALGSTESYTVGAGGAGGTQAGTNDGTAGGFSSFGTTVLLKAPGGSGGTVTGGAGGVIGNGDVTYVGGAGGINGGAGVSTDNVPSPRGGGGAGFDGGTPPNAVAGGAGGGFTTNYVKAGGAGGGAGVNNGTAASATSTGLIYGGVGGGGGGYNGTGTNTGGNGGNGNLGGGGGGANGTGTTAGTGGNGMVVVVTYF